MENTATISNFPNLPSEATLLDYFGILKIYSDNKEAISGLEKANAKLYEDFVNANRVGIKKILPKKGKVYKIIKVNDCFYPDERYGFNPKESEIKKAICYGYCCETIRVESKPLYRSAIPEAKMILLDKDGAAIKYFRGNSLGWENWEGRYEIDRLSSEDYPEIERRYKKGSSIKEKKELLLLEKLKMKYE